MAQVSPFRALRYNAARVDLAAVTAPPHDVIGPERKAACLREPLSVVRLALPEEGGDARFDRAAQHLREWQQQGFLERDGTPALYRYQVTAAGDGETMTGFFARVGLDATGQAVRAHERTLGRKRGDRLRLREATQCDVEPIWLLYRDEEAVVETLLRDAEEVSRFTDREGATHRLWRMDDPMRIQDIADWFRSRSLVIADGHHRYQSALEHFAATGRPEDASILALLAHDSQPGIRVEATHRLVRWGRTLEEAIAASRTKWLVQPLPAPSPSPAPTSSAVGEAPPARDPDVWSRPARELLQCLDGVGTAVVVGRTAAGLQAYALSATTPAEPGGIGVAVVQSSLLAACWGLDEQAAGTLTFERDAALCLAAVAAGDADLAVLIPPERVSSVLDAAKVGQLMPPKATYFVPKPPSGLVLGPLDEP